MIRNFLPDLPGTPPQDAINGKTYRYMQSLREAGELPASQSDCFVAPRGEYELYAYGKDRFCMENLHGRPGSEAVFRKLADRLERWRTATGDAFPGQIKLSSPKNSMAIENNYLIGATADALKNRAIDLRYSERGFIVFFNSNQKEQIPRIIHQYQRVTMCFKKLTHQQ